MPLSTGEPRVVNEGASWNAPQILLRTPTNTHTQGTLPRSFPLEQMFRTRIHSWVDWRATCSHALHAQCVPLWSKDPRLHQLTGFQTFFREVLMLPKTWTRIMLTTALLIRFKSSEMTKYIIAFANGAVQAHNKTQHKINKAKNDRVNLTAMTLSRSAHAVILSV